MNKKKTGGGGVESSFGRRSIANSDCRGSAGFCGVTSKTKVGVVENDMVDDKASGFSELNLFRMEARP